MKFKPLLVRAAIAATLAGLIGSVSAGDSNTTAIKLIGKDKKLESLKFEGELAVGESRGLYTDAGTPVTVQRTEQGLRIETPERTVDVPYGDNLDGAIHADGNVVIRDGDAGKRVVILHKDGHPGEDGTAHAEQKKRVILLKEADGSEVDVENLADLEALADIDIENVDGDKKVVVIRKVVNKDTSTEN